MTIRAAVLRCNPLCVSCEANGRTTAATEVDHIKPLHKGGTDDPDNLQGLCRDCHADKTRRDLGQKDRARFDASGRVVW